ncbi:MAG: hypothetical protein AB1650_05655, partial [Candidatus Omnitrophota bacterium]
MKGPVMIPVRKASHGLFRRIISTFLLIIFTFGMILPPDIARAQVIPMMPLPGSLVVQTPGYIPALIKGITVHPENPLAFDFIIDTGESGIDVQSQAFKDESMRLIKYFLASLTVPANEMWVNLSPYEKDRIIPQSFGLTEMGMDLLAQDYLLKQLTASLVYPEKGLGKKFWDRVYERAQKEFGTTDIPLDSFHKVWIVPSDALVYQKGNQAFVVRNKLKVMMEEDYLAMQNSQLQDTSDKLQEKSSPLTGLQTKVMKEVVLPEIEKEVNEGENFAQLRQIFQSMVLATWFKKSLKESLLGQVYADQNKVKGVDVNDPSIKEKIYDQYVKAFEQGVYNYIKEDYDPATQQIIPRNYFSGGAYGGSMPAVQKTVVAGGRGDTRAVRIETGKAVKPVGEDGEVAVNLVENRKEAGVLQAKAGKGKDESMLTEAEIKERLNSEASSRLSAIKSIKDLIEKGRDVTRWTKVLEERSKVETDDESIRELNEILGRTGDAAMLTEDEEEVRKFIYTKIHDVQLTIDLLSIYLYNSELLELMQYHYRKLSEGSDTIDDFINLSNDMLKEVLAAAKANGLAEHFEPFEGIIRTIIDEARYGDDQTDGAMLATEVFPTSLLNTDWETASPELKAALRAHADRVLSQTADELEALWTEVVIQGNILAVADKGV